jgi:hypothetical protein
VQREDHGGVVRDEDAGAGVADVERAVRDLRVEVDGAI